MQLHSTAMNGKSAAHRDAIPALILMFFHGYKDGPVAPIHSYSRMAVMASLENRPSLM